MDARVAKIEELFTEDCLYTDPDWEAIEGRDATNTLIAQAQEKFGDLRFSVGKVINAHHDLVLFSWRLGLAGDEPVATGYDTVSYRNGRIHKVYGFFE